MLGESGQIEVLGPADDGCTALEIFRRERPAGVVLDFQMPGLDGLQVLRAIRELDRKCLAILLTNHDEPSLKEQCHAAGADYFLDKSRDFERVLELVLSRLDPSNAEASVSNIPTED